MTAEDRTNRYYSNEWLIPIGDRAKKVLSQYPRPIAIEIANALLIEEDTGASDIPWTTVFPSDDINDVVKRLLAVIRTPDVQTPATNPDYRPTINDLKMILFKEGTLEGQFLALHAAYHLVRVAAGNLEEHFLTYRDMSRRWPQYTGDWEKKLAQQFGSNKSIDAINGNPELVMLLNGQQAIAREFESKGSLQKPDESIPDFLTRAFIAFNITSLESLESAAKLADKRFVDYRVVTYGLRGITLPNSN